MRYLVRLTTLAALPASLIIAGASPAHAACAEPTITVTPTSAAPGQQIAIRGREGRDACNDQPGAAPSQGAKNIRLRLVQGGQVADLGVVDASNDRTFVVRVQVPLTASSGKAKVIAQATDRAEAQVRILRQRAELPLTGGGASGLPLGVIGAAAGIALMRRWTRPDPFTR